MAHGSDADWLIWGLAGVAVVAVIGAAVWALLVL
jgi:hypothetical protein